MLSHACGFSILATIGIFGALQLACAACARRPACARTRAPPCRRRRRGRIADRRGPFRSEAGDAEGGAGQIDALMIAEWGRRRPPRMRTETPSVASARSSTAPSASSTRSPGFTSLAKFRVAGGGALAVARHGLDRDGELGAGLAAAQPPFQNLPRRIFGPCRSSRMAGKCAGFPGQRADGFDARPVLLARAVGGVQAEYVHAGGEQLAEQRVAGRAERRNDFCVSSHADPF